MATVAVAAPLRRRLPSAPVVLLPLARASSTSASTAAPSSSSSTSSSSSSSSSTSSKASGPMGWLSSLFGGAGKPRAHRHFNDNEERHVRLATRKKDKVLAANPGARVEPDFVSVAEGQQAAEDAFAIIDRYGISHVTEEQRAFMAGQMKHLPLPKEELGGMVNMMRVTGRFESEQQKLAPWGYGEEFDVGQVPAGLRLVLEKIQASEAFCLGKPRDITINFRSKHFYRLDPHVDPVKDGGNVFILGLLSGTVLTLTPPSKTMSTAQYTHMDQRRVSEQSWQPGKDVDVDLPERALLHLSGPARYEWGHGIRLGVTRNQIEDYCLSAGDELPLALKDEQQQQCHNQRHQGGEGAAGPSPTSLPLYDWWGSMREVRQRGPERLSIIFAFDDDRK